MKTATAILALFLGTSVAKAAGLSTTCRQHPGLCSGTRTYVCQGPGERIVTEITPLSQSDEYIAFRSRTQEERGGRVIRYSHSSTSKFPSYTVNFLGGVYLKYDYDDYCFWLNSENELHVKQAAFGEHIWLQLGPPYKEHVLNCDLDRQN